MKFFRRMILCTVSQCGNEISQTSKFCINCGCPVSVEGESAFNEIPQSNFDVVEDIKRKLREIDKRKKPPAKKGGVIKSTLEIIRGESSVLDLVFSDDFEAEKLADKKQLILDYPLPNSPKALASFAKYINSEIASKKREPDELTEVWKEKLNQIHLFAKAELSDSEEFAEIQKCHKDNKRRERHAKIREYVVFLFFPIIAAFCFSIAFRLPLLMFVTFLATGWAVFFVLYVYDLLDDMVASIKQHSAKRKNVPKILRIVAWHLLVPALAALITSILYHSVALIYLFAVLFGVDALFLLLFLCDVYDL